MRLIYLTDEEVELFGEITGNVMQYEGKKYKIVRVTNEGYYLSEIK